MTGARKPSSGRAKATADADAAFEKVAHAFAEDAAVTRGGRGFGAGALKVNGKIFAMLSSSGELVVKVSKQRADEIVASGKGDYFDPGHGRIMKQWITARTPASWLALAQEARRAAGAS